MRLTSTLLLASLAALATADNDWALSVKCAQKNPDFNTAIQAFCSKPNLVVPSSYASKGIFHGNVHVSIHGKCSPAQWIPLNYCNLQFHQICAKGDGFGSQRFGRGGCQHFKINSKKALPNPMGDDAKAKKGHKAKKIGNRIANIVYEIGKKHKHKKGKKHDHKTHKKEHEKKKKQGDSGGFLGPLVDQSDTKGKGDDDGYIGP